MGFQESRTYSSALIPKEERTVMDRGSGHIDGNNVECPTNESIPVLIGIWDDAEMMQLQALVTPCIPIRGFQQRN
jgi:hypothetical protein